MFLFQVFLAIAVPIGAYFGITGSDITTWKTLFALVFDAVSNPFVLFTIVVSVWNTVNDPTVAGMSDSKRALAYKEPNKDVR